MVGHTIESVEVRNRRIFPNDEKEIIGGKVKGVRRFGKVVVLDLSNGNSIVAHVKLTGQFIYRGPNLKNPPELSRKVFGGLGGNHTHVVFDLDRGGKLYYNDARRFGWVKITQSSDVKGQSFISKLGPEPFKDLTLAKFRDILGSTRRAVKVVLMDQAKMGGVGNIYANDSLWLSAISPRMPADRLSSGQVKSLHEAIEKVLKDGLKYGGASELAFVTPDGGEGEYQEHFLVYGQQGEPCERCHRGKIEKFTLGGRGTYWCPVCQKESKSVNQLFD